METQRVWTRRLANALRLAYRESFPTVSDETFAQERVGVAPRTLYYWASNADDTPLRSGTQQTLESFFEGLDVAVKARFYEVVGNSGGSTLLPAVVEPVGCVTVQSFDSMAEEVIQDLALDATSASDGIDMLQGRILGIARDYSDRSLIAEFEALKNLRNGCRDLNLRVRRPGERFDLLAVTGMSTALMASIAFDLGHWVPAAQMAEAASAYGSLAGHRSLEAWALGLQATIAFWDERSGQAISAIERGSLVALTPASRFRLDNIAARAYAVAGDRAGVSRSLDSARRNRDAMTDTSSSDALHDEIGGEFAFDDVRASACAAAAWLKLGDGHETEAYARATVERFDRGESPGQGPVRGARIDLAAAHVLQGDVDAAREDLAPILALPGDRKNMSLAGRVKNVLRLVESDDGQHPSSRAELGADLEDWLSTARSITND